MKLNIKAKHFTIPYSAFLILFVMLPLLFVGINAFTNDEGAFTLDNLIRFFTEANNFSVLLNSVIVAVATTVICLLLGYPIAYVLANKKYNRSKILVLFFILPMWVNFLLRTLAVRSILFDIFLMQRGMIPLIIGSVYDFLPFMMLPIYTTLLNIDPSYKEAAQDLGSNSVTVFLKVTLPLSIPGIVSGILMVFMPSVSMFAIQDILGGTEMLFGKYIDFYFNGQGSDWNMGSMLSLILILFIAVSLVINKIFTKKTGDSKRSVW